MCLFFKLLVGLEILCDYEVLESSRTVCNGLVFLGNFFHILAQVPKKMSFELFFSCNWHILSNHWYKEVSDTIFTDFILLLLPKIISQWFLWYAGQNILGISTEKNVRSKKKETILKD